MKQLYYRRVATILQAAKRGTSSLPLLPLTNPPPEKYYFHSLPRVALLSCTSPLRTYTPPSPLLYSAINIWL